MIDAAELEPTDIEKRVQQEVENLKKKPIISEMLDELRANLPEHLKYHGQENEEGITHSEDVLHDAILFALIDGISDERSLELVAIMAVYHDAGFLDQFAKNEPMGAKRAKEAMIKAGDYIDGEIKVVTDGINATQVIMEDGILKQMPAPNALSKYLLDADVSNFGRKDFRNKSDLVFEEVQLQNPNQEINKTNFLKTSLGFIKNHEWNTEAAQRLRVPQQQINIQNLEAELSPAV